MVNIRPCIWLTCIVALASFAVSAKDLVAYHVGDTAEDDITTPVALDVIDPTATAARQAAVAAAMPVIFRSYPQQASNVVTAAFLSAFDATRSNFLAALGEDFLQLTSNNDVTALPVFENFTAAFSHQSKFFPIPDDLAADWARGGTGLETQTRWLDALLRMMHRPIRPDALPVGVDLGETSRLVPVNNLNAVVTLASAERDGKLVTQGDLTTLSQARLLFHQEFPHNQQSLARALAAFLKPNCTVDANLTRQARDNAVRQLVVANHYDAGQLLVRRGEVIDAKIEAALDQLREKTTPGLLAQQVAAERELAEREQAAAQQARDDAQREHAQAVEMREQVLNAQVQASNIRERNRWLVAALATVSAAALLGLWRLAVQRGRRGSLLPVPVAARHPQSMQAELAPHLVQVLKETVVQELAAQRRELLRAQEEAAVEIAAIVHRLDAMHAPMQERLRAYEARIQELEKELSALNEENRELLKLKIDMIRRQLEVERVHNRVKFPN